MELYSNPERVSSARFDLRGPDSRQYLLLAWRSGGSEEGSLDRPATYDAQEFQMRPHWQD